MLTVEQAREAVMDRVRPMPPRRVGLGDALGLVLAEAVASDIDLPPFDKALVDGFAIRASDCEGEGFCRLALGEEVVAGCTPTRPLAVREAAVVMTGAPLPLGVDAVVMHEKTRRDGDFVLIPGPVSPGEGRLPRGREIRAGAVAVASGIRLNATHLGVLASVGRSSVLVRDRPLVAILPTGDELVPIAQVPGPGQIREANSSILAAMVRQLGFVADPRPVVPDDLDASIAAFRNSLAEADVMIVCGGVSAGDRDFVPRAFSAVGVEQVFHKVRLKPGKPLFFGMGPPRADGFRPPVFGLPGNPVSGIVGFLLFVAPALRILNDQGGDARPGVRGKLASTFSHRGDRPSYHPAKALADGLHPLDSAGSADLLSVSRSDGFLCFPSGRTDFAIGEELDFLPITP